MHMIGVDLSTVGNLLMIHTELVGVPDHDGKRTPLPVYRRS